jgi:hypothetical protein
VSAPEAAAYLRTAMRDLDRAAHRLAGVQGAAPEQEATEKAAELVAEILQHVERLP